MCYQTAILRLTLAAVAMLFVSQSTDAGWVTIKNDTKAAVVVTDSAKGKPVTIQPGETYREYQMAAGNKNVSIANSTKPNTPILSSRLTWATDDVRYTIRSEGTGIKLIQDPIPKK